MEGKILSFNANKGFGFIVDKNNENYFFHISKVINPFEIENQRNVSFQIGHNDKGKIATKIKVNTKQHPKKTKTNTNKKSNFFKFNDGTTVNLKDIQSFCLNIEYTWANEININDIGIRTYYYNLDITFKYGKKLVVYLSTHSPKYKWLYDGRDYDILSSNEEKKTVAYHKAKKIIQKFEAALNEL